MELLLTISLLFSGYAFSYGSDCDPFALKSCADEINERKSQLFDSSIEEFKENCGKAMEAVRCVKNYIDNCLPVGSKDIVSSSAVYLKIFEDKCTSGTELNQIFLKNMECFRRASGEISECESKFEKSQIKIVESSLSPSKKHYHGCCAFDWWNKCKARTVEEECDSAAAEGMNKISEDLTTNVMSQTCSSITMGSFENCFGLYGVEGKAHVLNASLLILLMCFILLEIRNSFS